MKLAQLEGGSQEKWQEAESNQLENRLNIMPEKFPLKVVQRYKNTFPGLQKSEKKENLTIYQERRDISISCFAERNIFMAV